jgi:hypothetical protein
MMMSRIIFSFFRREKEEGEEITELEEPKAVFDDTAMDNPMGFLFIDAVYRRLQDELPPQ